MTLNMGMSHAETQGVGRKTNDENWPKRKKKG